jgi:hypothetical protein
VPLDIQHTQTVLDVMPSQYLERYDQRVLHEVRVDGSVEDLNGAIVRGGGEEGVGSVVDDRSKRFGMVPVETKISGSIPEALITSAGHQATHLKVL